MIKSAEEEVWLQVSIWQAVEFLQASILTTNAPWAGKATTTMLTSITQVRVALA